MQRVQAALPCGIDLGFKLRLTIADHTWFAIAKVAAALEDERRREEHDELTGSLHT